MSTETQTPPTEHEIRLPIGGMTCASCVRRVERSLEKKEGVKSVAVNLATEEATIDFDPAVVQAADLVATIESAGYSVPTTTVTLPVDGMTCASCVRQVEKALEKVDGVQSVSVNLATETATIQGHAGSLDRSVLESAVVRAGYAIRESDEATESEDDSLTDRRLAELRNLKIKAIAALAVSALLMFLMYWPDWLFGGQPFDSM
ncbi:MAG: copper ion binding protein, partial [Thermomicrobiales bacterium]|nr:copper ion binding protein [Thermomicrobiales bacterium]